VACPGEHHQSCACDRVVQLVADVDRRASVGVAPDQQCRHADRWRQVTRICVSKRRGHEAEPERMEVPIGAPSNEVLEQLRRKAAL
jgi:hypothetical protein